MLQVYEAYGQTECTAGCTYTTPGDWTPGERWRGGGRRQKLTTAKVTRLSLRPDACMTHLLSRRFRSGVRLARARQSGLATLLKVELVVLSERQDQQAEELSDQSLSISQHLLCVFQEKLFRENATSAACASSLFSFLCVVPYNSTASSNGI